MIEILMATYNGEENIRDQMDSILTQTCTDWRLLVSDDGSTDGTDSIIDEYAYRYSGRVQRVCAGKRFGGAKAHFFWLTAQSDAPYLAFSDQDDVWCGRKLEVLYRAMRDAETRLGSDAPILVFSDQTVTDEKLNMLAPSLMRYQRDLSAGNRSGI